MRINLDGTLFRLNDRVMQMRNNYDIKLYDRSGKQVSEGVFNGDIGTIRKISGTNVVIEFDGRYESSFPTGKEDSASCTVNLPPCHPFLHG